MWFIYKKVILTKDKLAKRCWNGCTKCVFCGSRERINHVHFVSIFPSSLESGRCTSLIIPTPLVNVTNLFGNWLNEIDKKMRDWIRVGVCVLAWEIWNWQNDVVFNIVAKLNFSHDIRRRLQFTCGLISFLWTMETYEYWVQLDVGGCRSYNQPRWLATC
jgi:hypothetical protein